MEQGRMIKMLKALPTCPTYFAYATQKRMTFHTARALTALCAANPLSRHQAFNTGHWWVQGGLPIVFVVALVQAGCLIGVVCCG